MALLFKDLQATEVSTACPAPVVIKVLQDFQEHQANQEEVVLVQVMDCQVFLEPQAQRERKVPQVYQAMVQKAFPALLDYPDPLAPQDPRALPVLP